MVFFFYFKENKLFKIISKNKFLSKQINSTFNKYINNILFSFCSRYVVAELFLILNYGKIKGNKDCILS